MWYNYISLVINGGRKLKICALRVSAMMTNCYFLCADPQGKGSCAVIDPGGDAEELREKLEAKALVP